MHGGSLKHFIDFSLSRPCRGYEITLSNSRDRFYLEARFRITTTHRMPRLFPEIGILRAVMSQGISATSYWIELQSPLAISQNARVLVSATCPLSISLIFFSATVAGCPFSFSFRFRAFRDAYGCFRHHLPLSLSPLSQASPIAVLQLR